MTVDEAISDLLSISTDIRRVAVLGADGEVAAAAPGSAGNDLPAVAGRLWEAAATRAAALAKSPLEYVIVRNAEGAVVVLQREAHRIVAETGPQPAVGLLIFDLRTCLGDAYPVEAEA
jgi:predicted regulator of Ras-like GTPase activity (Roadblock/LC7/MglB family)